MPTPPPSMGFDPATGDAVLVAEPAQDIGLPVDEAVPEIPDWYSMADTNE